MAIVSGPRNDGQLAFEFLHRYVARLVGDGDMIASKDMRLSSQYALEQMGQFTALAMALPIEMPKPADHSPVLGSFFVASST